MKNYKHENMIAEVCLGKINQNYSFKLFLFLNEVEWRQYCFNYWFNT